MFLACATQWRVVPMGGIIGLDYTALAVVAKALQIKLSPTILSKIQMLEADFMMPESKKLTAEKACRSAPACAMCRKPGCHERIGANASRG